MNTVGQRTFSQCIYLLEWLIILIFFPTNFNQNHMHFKSSASYFWQVFLESKIFLLSPWHVSATAILKLYILIFPNSILLTNSFFLHAWSSNFKRSFSYTREINTRRIGVRTGSNNVGTSFFLCFEMWNVNPN